ncbi:hypothetical protein CDO26_06675 [Sinorhizobium meliloti]|nr:hypothetical protein CDO26_06675 [Sinorhizobium meliloti]RVG83477.1 hypothetical protein CN218_34080 [Sinorhizobium meliloti]RVK86514.1 hypothetical protein CN150_34300 [Sinorhizobium meliloti]
MMRKAQLVIKRQKDVTVNIRRLSINRRYRCQAYEAGSVHRSAGDLRDPGHEVSGEIKWQSNSKRLAGTDVVFDDDRFPIGCHQDFGFLGLHRFE